MKKTLETALFLASFFAVFSLLAVLPIAIFASSKVTSPWKTVSVLSILSFASAIAWLLLGFGC